MTLRQSLRWARYAACGAIVAVSAAGVFGYDHGIQETIAAFLGGAATAVIVKAIHIV